MSAPPETQNKPTNTSGPESPTTARPFEMDDDDVQESGVLGADNATGNNNNNISTTATASLIEEAAPAKPPRPLTEAQKNENILKEAFPTVEIGVIRAIMRASSGRIDPAFHALLEMTDPEAAKNEPEEEQAPPQPPRPQMSQLEADERYARQLAERWETGAYEARTSNRGVGEDRSRQQQGATQDREHDFFEDDLPVIQERLKQGFMETQTKVNSWITNMKKRFDEEFTEEEGDENRQRPTRGQEQFPGPRPGQTSRRSGDYERYDADPQVLSDDFAGMRFASDGTPVRTTRNVASPDLFRPPPPSKSPRSADGRRVAFRDATDDIDAYGSSPRADSAEAGSKTKQSKWQPLSTVDPNPINDNDPFSLGDSEDEREAKEKTASKEIKMDDAERLKQAAAEAMADSLVEEKSSQAGAGAAASTDTGSKKE